MKWNAMLAKLVAETDKNANAIPEFDWWVVLLVQPNAEQRSADLLQRAMLYPYLPTYSKSRRQRGKLHRPRLYAVIPGYLFLPERMMLAPGDRDVLFERAGVRGFIRNSDGYPARASKEQIEMIRVIEAKLNLPPERKGVLFNLGQTVTFKDDLYWAWKGPIVEICNENRIGVEVLLFGRKTLVYTTAAEIEGCN